MEFLKRAENSSEITISAVWNEADTLPPYILEYLNDDIKIVTSPEELLKYSDGIMILLRDGAKHIDLAKRLSGHKIALWIDKPFAISVSDAEKIMEMLNESGTIFDGGSNIKFSPGVKKSKNNFKATGINIFRVIFPMDWNWTVRTEAYIFIHII